MIQAATYTSEAELRAAYKAREERKRQAARRAATANQNAPAVTTSSRVPVPCHVQRFYEAHVLAWQAWKAEEGMKCKVHLRRRCAELGVSYDDLIGPSRKRAIVQARDLLAFEIKMTVRPHISWPELGRLLNREHSAVYYAVMKMRAAAGDEKAIDSIEKRKQRMRKAKAAFNLREEQGA